MRKRPIETISTEEIRDIREVTPLECSIPFNVTPSGVVFNDDILETDRPLDTALINESSINEELMELLNLVETAAPQQGTSDANLLLSSSCSPEAVSPQISSFVTSQGNQECTTNEQETPIPALMDDPLTDQFSDLTSLLLDPTLLSSLSSSSLQIFEPADKILDLESPTESLTTTSNSPLSTSPPTPSDNTVPSCSPLPLERKRKQSSTETNDDHLPTAKKEKYVERRKKNNVASQISRAKRRQKNSDLFLREKELEKQNADLRVKVEEMTKEAERLKKMLIDQLAH